MPSFFELFTQTLFHGAPLQGPTARALATGLSQGFHTLFGKGQKMNQAMWAHMPTYQQTPTALGPMGDDRLIDRGFQETDAAYALRLKQAFDTWGHAGSALVDLQQILGYVSPSTPLVRMVHSTWSGANSWSTWYTIPAGSPVGTLPQIYRTTPANWDWDGDHSPKWWRAWPIIYPPASLWTSGSTWGDGSLWGDGRAWGGTYTPAQASSLTRLMAKWKSKHTWIPWIIVSFDSTLFNPFAAFGDPSLPNGQWGQWATTSGNQYVPARAANARYIDGAPKADQIIG